VSVPQILGVPRARPAVELGIGMSWAAGGTGGVWDESNWDDATSTWAGVEPWWVDVTCEVLDIQTFCGRERNTDVFDVGTATVTLRNDDGWADYPQTLPPEDLRYLLTVRPGIGLRIGVAIDGAEDPEWLWRGYVDATTPGFIAGEGDVVVCDCIDAKGEVGRQILAKLSAPIGAGEPVTQRVNRILDAAEWPTALRTIDASAIPLVATDLDGSVVDLLNIAAESAGASVYGGADGDVTMRQLDWQAWESDLDPDGTIGTYSAPLLIDLDEDPPESDLYVLPAGMFVENPSGSGLYELFETSTYRLAELPPGSHLYWVALVEPPTVCPSAWELSNARADFATRVIVAREGFDPLPPATDPEGVGLYGLEVYSKTDLETQEDTDLTMLRNRWLVTRGVDNAPRIPAVTIDAGTADNTVDIITTVDPRLPSRYRCRHVEAGPDGDPIYRIDRMMFATSVEHTIVPDSWVCRIGLDDAEPWMIGATSGRWDTTGVWDESTWAKRLGG
jgi:hypothetical protein